MFLRLSKTRSFGIAGLIGAAILSTLAIANYFIARRTERRHPSKGSFLTVEGVRLHYSDRGEGDPAVLIHGNAVTGDDWNTSGVADRLLQTHRVIIFDRPGFGHSDRPRGHIWTPEKQAELLHKAMRKLNIERPIIVAHSSGTLVALALAARHKADLGGLVLVSGYYFWTLRLEVVLAAVGALPLLGDLLNYTISPLLGWLEMPLLKWLMFSPTRIPKRFQAEYSTAMALRPSQIRATSEDDVLMIPAAIALRRSYKDMTLPVALIAGDSDKIVFKQASEHLAACLPNSVLQIVKGAGHMVHYTAPLLITEAVDNIAKDLSAIGHGKNEGISEPARLFQK